MPDLTTTESADYRRGLADAIPLACIDCKKGDEPVREEDPFCGWEWNHHKYDGDRHWWDWCIASNIREKLREDEQQDNNNIGDV